MIAVGACAAAISGCGSSAHRPYQRIRLHISAPPTVHTGTATIAGTVAPATATVLVLGRRVQVREGSFTTAVSLAPGTNIVDVLAGAPRERDAMSAVRVFRQVYVTVPDLSGDTPSAAQRQLTTLGLVADINKDDAFFSFLIPGGDSVCGTDPARGARLAPGSTVTVAVSKTC